MTMWARRLILCLLGHLAAVGCAVPKQLPKSNYAEGIGHARSTILVAADPSARWVAFCQPRTDSEVRVGRHGELFGGSMDMYLALESGRGQFIEALYGSDPNGRYLVVSEKGKLVLMDITTRSRVDLSAMGAVAPRALLPTVTFDARGHLVYLRRSGKRIVLIVRELATGKERQLDTGNGTLLAVHADRGHHTIRYSVVDRDTDGNGRLEAPKLSTNMASTPCRGPALSATIRRRSGDTPSVKTLTLGHASTIEPTSHVDRAQSSRPIGLLPNHLGKRRGPLAIARDGRWLIPAHYAKGARALPRGPLRWLEPPAKQSRR